MKAKPSIEIQDFRLTLRLAEAGWFEALPDEILCVTLTFCADYSSARLAADEVHFVAHFSFRELARQAYQQARAILTDYGFLGYRDEWLASDFPISDFLRLHYALAGEPPHRDSLAAELVLLTELLKERKA